VDGWPALICLVLSFPFLNYGCPVLALFARAGTMLRVASVFMPSGLHLGESGTVRVNEG
jgi:hypothetical protein